MDKKILRDYVQKNNMEKLKKLNKEDLSIEDIQFLIDDGANLLINDKKILIKAAISDNLKAVKLMYKQYPDDEIFFSIWRK